MKEVKPLTTYRIDVDDREQDSAVINVLRSMPEVVLQVHRLKVGDYYVDERILFERKTLADFAASLITGRLFRQAIRLSQAGCLCGFIIEGTGASLSSLGIRREAMQGALISLQFVFEIPILRSFDCAETARLLLYAAGQLRRQASSWHAGRGYRPKKKRTLQMRLLRQLPGVGPKRAEALLEAFGSINAIVNADETQLAEIEGMGKRTVQAMRMVLD